MNKELEEAKRILNMWNKAEEIVIKEDTKYDKRPYIERKQAIETVLQALKDYQKENIILKVANEEAEELLENSIPKERIEETFEYIEDYVERLNGPDEDIEYIRNKKKELLEKK